MGSRRNWCICRRRLDDECQHSPARRSPIGPSRRNTHYKSSEATGSVRSGKNLHPSLQRERLRRFGFGPSTHRGHAGRTSVIENSSKRQLLRRCRNWFHNGWLWGKMPGNLPERPWLEFRCKNQSRRYWSSPHFESHLCRVPLPGRPHRFRKFRLLYSWVCCD